MNKKFSKVPGLFLYIICYLNYFFSFLKFCTVIILHSFKNILNFFLFKNHLTRVWTSFQHRSKNTAHYNCIKNESKEERIILQSRMLQIILGQSISLSWFFSTKNLNELIKKNWGCFKKQPFSLKYIHLCPSPEPSSAA